MKTFITVVLLLGSVSASLTEKRSHNQPHWLEECWDHGEGHFVNPLCQLLTTTTTSTTEATTTTTEPTTTTTEATTTTTEPTTTLLPVAGNFVGEEITTTTTLPPTTTPRTCDYLEYNVSDIKRTDFGTDEHVNAARLRNETVHVINSLDACKTTCENSLLQDNYECWAFTYNADERCYLYYYDRPLLFIPTSLKVNGTTLFLKRCSDNPFGNYTRAPAPTPTSTPKAVVTPAVHTNESTSASPVTGPPTNVSTESITPTTPTTPGVVTVSTPTTTPVTFGPDTPTTTPVTVGPDTPTTTPVTVGPDTGSTSTSSIPVIIDTSTPSSATTESTSAAAGGSSPTQTPVTGPPPVTTSSVTPGPGITGQPSVTTGVTGAPGVVTGAPGFLGGVTRVPSGVVQISKDTFRINGVPSPTPDMCFFVNKTFANGDSWKDTCRYNCTCSTSGTVNTATCHDICPFYMSIPSNCKIVKKPGDCCDSLNCTGPTVPTPTVNGTDCVDHNASCLIYEDEACRTPYIPWARSNCPLRCDFCLGKAYPCRNEISYCDRYDLAHACVNYKGWARQNCRLACSMCNAPGWNPEGVNVPSSATTTPAAPPIST